MKTSRSLSLPPFLAIGFTVIAALATPGDAHAQSATTTVLHQTSACAQSGCITTLTATVTAGQKAVYPGLVYFCDGTGVSCENQVPSGVSELQASGIVTLRLRLAAGTHTLYAIFHGTKTYARSKSVPQSLTIAPATTTGKATVTSISASGSADGYTLSSTVSALRTPATGVVSFLDSSNHNALVTTAPLVAGKPLPVYASGGLDFSKVQPNSLAGATSAVAGDFNNDGYQDIEVAGMLLLGDGKGGFTPVPLPAGGAPPPVNTVDLNNDGIPDTAALGFVPPTGQGVYISLGDGNGNYTPAPQSPLLAIEDTLTNLVVADFRNNGIQDIAVLDTYQGGITIDPGNGDGTFPVSAFGLTPGIGCTSFFVSDFDGDGIPDILTVDYGTTITLYHGNGDLTFTPRPKQTIVPAGDGLAGLTTGDFNGDGIMGVLATYSTPNGSRILQPLFYNAQKTAFDPGPTIPLSSGAFYTFADFNGDGLSDFATFGPYPITGYTYEEITPASGTSGPGITLPGATTHSVIASYPGDPLHNASVSVALPLAGSATAFPGGIAGQPGLTLNGAASLANNSIQLTDGKQFEAGSFFSSNRVPVAGFSTEFDFQLTNAEADGFAFVIQNNGPDAIGSGGGGLGYGNPPPNENGPGIIGSVAVAFDLHNNQGEGYNSIRLEYNGVTSAAFAYPSSEATDLTPSGIDLHSGHRFHATIAFNGRFAVTITDLDKGSVFTNVLPSNGQSIDLNNFIDGSTAYVGFTGGTGARTAVQTISNWVFTPTAAPLLYPSPNFPTGFAGSSGLHFNGGAAVSGNAIDLTYGTHFEAPSVYFTSPIVPLPKYPIGFFTDFDFQVESGIGDGFTFVIQDQGLNARGSSGGGLGYGPDHPNGAGASIANSVAIKFDLHNNAGEGVNSTGIYINGASPTTPAIDLTPSGIDLKSGHLFHAHIGFNNGYFGGNVYLVITDLTNYRVFNTYLSAFPSEVPSIAYAGFTAGTGATPSSIKILNWTWTEY